MEVLYPEDAKLALIYLTLTSIKIRHYYKIHIMLLQVNTLET